MNCSFGWQDSYNKQRVTSKSPLIDQYSSMYNFAVTLARLGCYMDLSGEGIKQASLYFQQAAWVFNELMSFVAQIPAGESSLDFAKETLQMNSNLCLAQAQYLFFRKGSDAGLPADKLAEVSAQVAVYFQKAFENN